jgi:shikimate dehydrogenase
MPKYIGLIGYPLKHSISPYFQQAALDYYQLDIRYQAWETVPGELGEAVSRLRQPQNMGANVTVPYKESVLNLLDKVDEVASLIGAVNTIVKRDDRLVGFNTDAHGFIQALREHGDFDPESKRAVILGAGGAARAASFALVQERVASLTIINRTLERAEALADSLRSHRASVGLETEIVALPWANVDMPETFEGCHLVVNCTTIGMKHSPEEGKSPLGLEAIPGSALVYDLIYNPSPTPLLQLAQRAGANILGGLPMLVYQGAASFELWTGKKARLHLMLRKAEEALQKFA